MLVCLYSTAYNLYLIFLVVNMLHFDTEWHNGLADRKQIYTFRFIKTTDLHSIRTSVFVTRCDILNIVCPIRSRADCSIMRQRNSVM